MGGQAHSRAEKALRGMAGHYQERQDTDRGHRVWCGQVRAHRSVSRSPPAFVVSASALIAPTQCAGIVSSWSPSIARTLPPSFASTCERARCLQATASPFLFRPPRPCSTFTNTKAIGTEIPFQHHACNKFQVLHSSNSSFNPFCLAFFLKNVKYTDETTTANSAGSLAPFPPSSFSGP